MHRKFLCPKGETRHSPRWVGVGSVSHNHYKSFVAHSLNHISAHEGASMRILLRLWLVNLDDMQVGHLAISHLIYEQYHPPHPFRQCNFENKNPRSCCSSKKGVVKEGKVLGAANSPLGDSQPLPRDPRRGVQGHDLLQKHHTPVA